MTLDNEDRAYLEKTIDTTVGQVPGIVQMARIEDYHKHGQYKEADDFVLGFATGIIYGRFVQYFVAVHQRQLSDEETTEGNRVILRRMREIKDAIFNCGKSRN